MFPLGFISSLPQFAWQKGFDVVVVVVIEFVIIWLYAFLVCAEAGGNKSFQFLKLIINNLEDRIFLYATIFPLV
jgi:hypothetical protein